MTTLGIVESVDEFYAISYEKWEEYLSCLKCGKHMLEKTGIQIDSMQDLKNHMEEFKIYMRGHN